MFFSKIQKSLVSLCDYYKDYFSVGTALSKWTLFNKGIEQKLALKHFNEFVAENLTKPMFIYKDENTSEISRCYSISYKSSSDNSTVASPFAGANSANYTKITINGVLNNCYYLNF